MIISVSIAKKLHQKLTRIKQDYSNELTVKAIPYPLDLQGSGYEAAAVSICAAMETEYSTSIHASIYEHQPEHNDLEADHLITSAVPDNNERNALQNCLQYQAYDDYLSENIALGEQLNLNSVPVLIINGEKYTGALSERQLIAIIEKHLE